MRAKPIQITLFKALFRKLFNAGSTPAQQAYDLWATAYDNQPDNLMLALDDQLFSAFLQTVDIKNKELVDIGCGTGRYWQKILDREPRQLVGYDVSAGMLQILRKKFPMAVSFQLSGNHLAQTPDKSVELLISTLTMAHIKDAAAALQEWNRVALPAADIFITGPFIDRTFPARRATKSTLHRWIDFFVR